MKIYITKYIFTDGIIQHDAEIKDGMAIVRMGSGLPLFLHVEGKDWHATKESAIKRAEELRIRKLKSLDKQHKKISAMVFI